MQNEVTHSIQINEHYSHPGLQNEGHTLDRNQRFLTKTRNTTVTLECKTKVTHRTEIDDFDEDQKHNSHPEN